MKNSTNPLLIVAVSGILFLVTTVHHLSEIMSIGLVGFPLIAWVLDGGLAAGVCYLGWRVTKAEFSTAERQTVLSWTVGGAIAGGTLIGLTFLIRIAEGRTLAEPMFPLLVGINGGALVATIGGYHAAQSTSTARKFEEIFDNTYQFTGLLTQDGTLIEVNDTALSFSGLERKDVVGKKLWNSYWVDPYEESQEAIKQSVTDAQERKLFKEQIRIQGETGSAVIDFSVRPMEDDSGEITRLIVEGRDITTIQRQQEHLTVLHRYLRHNLRNDLNKIKGYAGLLFNQLEEETHTIRAERIHQTASELIDSSELVKGFSEAAVIDEGDVSPYNLKPIVNNACDSSSVPTSQVKIDVRSDLTICADDRVHTVFEEFLNAIGTHIEPGGEILITQTTFSDRTELEVICSGFDIPSIELSAFDGEGERSSTYHPGGIRFWLVKSMIRGYGGSVSYDEEPGDETSIMLTLKHPKERNSKQPEPTI